MSRLFGFRFTKSAVIGLVGLVVGSGGLIHAQSSVAPATRKAPTGFVPPSEQVQRYIHFFHALAAWDEAAKQLDDRGDASMADLWRTRLETRSTLTMAEAAQVRQIAQEWRQEETARSQNAHAVVIKVREQNPRDRKSLYLYPEMQALNLQQWDLVNQAIARLTSSLGSRSFTKLDLFTLHMDDHAKAMQANRQPATSSQEEVK